MSPRKSAFEGRSVTPHQSATVMPRVNSDLVSISTLMRRPEKSSGAIRYAITQGSCNGAPDEPYFSESKRSKKSVHPATASQTGLFWLRSSVIHFLLVNALCVTSRGAITKSIPELNTSLADSGSTNIYVSYTHLTLPTNIEV